MPKSLVSRVKYLFAFSPLFGPVKLSLFQFTSFSTSGILVSADTGKTESPAAMYSNAIGNNFQLQNFMKPIYSSYRAMSAIDDAFIVYPDFILVVYYYAGYNILAGQSPWSGTNDTTRQTRTIDNSNGTTPIFITSQNLYGSSNQVQSCRVYYKSLSNELQLPYFSYSV